LQANWKLFLEKKKRSLLFI